MIQVNILFSANALKIGMCIVYMQAYLSSLIADFLIQQEADNNARMSGGNINSNRDLY